LTFWTLHFRAFSDESVIHELVNVEFIVAHDQSNYPKSRECDNHFPHELVWFDLNILDEQVVTQWDKC